MIKVGNCTIQTPLSVTADESIRTAQAEIRQLTRGMPKHHIAFYYYCSARRELGLATSHPFIQALDDYRFKSEKALDEGVAAFSQKKQKKLLSGVIRDLIAVNLP